MDVAGPNEGLRVLDDFVCTAVPEPGLPTGSPHAVGTNAGVHVLSQVPEGVERLEAKDLKSQLRSLSVSQLHAFLRTSGERLTREELLILHDIATEKLIQERGSDPTDAERLSRAVFETALRMA
jgi:hypothetical protein